MAARGADVPPGAAVHGDGALDVVGWVGDDGQGEAAAGAEGRVGEAGHGDCCAPAKPAGTSSTTASERARAQIISVSNPVLKAGGSTICPAADMNPSNPAIRGQIALPPTYSRISSGPESVSRAGRRDTVRRSAMDAERPEQNWDAKFMARYDFRTPRLFVEPALAAGTSVPLDPPQSNYLFNVLRLSPGDGVLAFNGRDGEWQAELERAGKKIAALRITAPSRPQEQATDLHYLFAPLKHARLDYMVQKAVELGVSRLQPVTTRHTQMSRVNLDRMRANAIEAAEQCGILNIPEIEPPLALGRLLAAMDARLVIFCDEDAETRDPVAALSACRKSDAVPPLAVLVGPEGGFAEEERALLLRRDNVLRLALGPRILRADTAAVAALAIVQTVLGDWR
jgi:16S rRNA (uracil1498-N3)-methyltransferase